MDGKGREGNGSGTKMDKGTSSGKEIWISCEHGYVSRLVVLDTNVLWAFLASYLILGSKL